MKRLRGDVRTGAHHPKLEASGAEYWALHCWNSVAETAITRNHARLAARVAGLHADPMLAALHAGAVAHHRDQIAALLQTEAAQAFVATFRDYRGAFDWSPDQFAVVCPDLALELPYGEPIDYRARLKTSRQSCVKFARSHYKLPWFADADATGVDFGQGRAGTRSKDESLAPLDAESFVGDHRITHGAKPKRRRTRQAFLAGLGQRQKTWGLLGSSDPGLVRDLQRQVDPERLFVVQDWGYSSAQVPIGRASRQPDIARVAQDLDALSFVDSFAGRLKSGRLRVIRAEPYFALKTLPPGYFDALYLSSDMNAAPSLALLMRVISRIASGGLLVVDGYHRRGRHGDALQVALHATLARQGAALRIRAIDGAHCAIERLAPL